MSKMHYFIMRNIVSGNLPCIKNNFKSPKEKKKKLLNMREMTFSDWYLLVPGISLVELIIA